MNYTTIEQSKKLLELGLSPETADMCYDILTGDEYPQLVRLKLTDKHWMQLYSDVLMPCWSFGALIDLMPDDIQDKNDQNVSYFWEFRKNSVMYSNLCPGIGNHKYLHWENMNSFFDCIYNTVCWLLENKYIKR